MYFSGFSYYIINAKWELPYYSIDISKKLLHEKIIKTITEISEELENEDFNFFYDKNVVDSIIDMS
jgi:hypothetical protein